MSHPQELSEPVRSCTFRSKVYYPLSFQGALHMKLDWVLTEKLLIIVTELAKYNIQEIKIAAHRCQTCYCQDVLLFVFVSVLPIDLVPLVGQCVGLIQFTCC